MDFPTSGLTVCFNIDGQPGDILRLVSDHAGSGKFRRTSRPLGTGEVGVPPLWPTDEARRATLGEGVPGVGGGGRALGSRAGAWVLELCFLTSPALWPSVLDLGASVLGGRARETRSAGPTGLRSRPESMGGRTLLCGRRVPCAKARRVTVVASFGSRPVTGGDPRSSASAPRWLRCEGRVSVTQLRVPGTRPYGGPGPLRSAERAREQLLEVQTGVRASGAAVWTAAQPDSAQGAHCGASQF